jgi:hypothetical protein
MEVPRQAIAHLANELGTSIADFDDESFGTFKNRAKVVDSLPS